MLPRAPSQIPPCRLRVLPQAFDQTRRVAYQTRRGPYRTRRVLPSVLDQTPPCRRVLSEARRVLPRAPDQTPPCRRRVLP